jgi:hypothetical protein
MMTGNLMNRIRKKLSAPHVIIPLLGFAAAFIFLYTFTEQAPKKRKKGTGIPGSLKQMDLWGAMRQYPSKTMDASEFSNAYVMARQMPTVSDMSMNGPNAPATNPWTELGPMNFAGRILSIGFHPTDPNTMWVGSASGGLWKTTNGGRGAANGINWTYVPTGNFPVLGIGSIAVNPSNANEIYVGTGEVYNGDPGGSTGAGHYRLFRGSYGIGILKSTNGGTSWTKTLDFGNSSLKGVMDMVIHPTNTSVVFAATTDGVYRTTNAGGSWTLIHPVVFAMDLLFKPGDPNVLYVASGNFQSAGGGIYKTIDCLAGTPAFFPLNSGLPATRSGKIHLAISAANPTRVYASVGRDPNTSHTQGLYVSTNEGSSWTAAAAPTILGNQGWYAHDVAVSPTNANRVIWAELDTYLSTDGGASFTKTGFWNQWDIANTSVGDTTEGLSNATNYVHADVHRIQLSPHNNNTFFLCTDGGLFRTTDGGSTFHTLNGGLNTAQIYSNMAQHPTIANYMLIGLQDNEAMVYEGNPGCRRIGQLGDGFHAAMNFNGTIQLVESYYFNRRRSTNSGGTWGAGSGAVPTTEVACFNVPMVFSRAPSSALMYAGTVLFKRSANSGSTWTNLNGGSPISGANAPAIAMVAPTNNRVYFSTAPDEAGGIRSKMWRTANAQYPSPTFTEITNGLPDRYYSGIDVDPIDSNRIVVTLSGFGSSHVYISHNGGNTWSDMGGGLPDVPHNSVFINPAARNQVYVSNDLGVFVANNVPTSGVLGATTSVYWNSYNEGLPTAIMANHIVITNTGKLRLATYGRGLWERDVASLTIPVNWKQFRAWPVDKGNQLQWVVSNQSNVKQYDVEYSKNGTQFTKLNTVYSTSGAGDITYNYLHEFDKNIDVFYRIKQVDNDGAAKYSAVVLVKAHKLITQLTAFPNPTAGVFNIKLSAQNAATADIKIYNATGMLMLQQKQQLRQGTNTILMDIGRFAAGTYQLVCEGENSKQTISIIKK